MSGLFDIEEIKKNHQKMVQMGPRLTGSAAHKEFIESIKRELTAIGLEPKTDTLHFKRWEPGRWALSFSDGGKNTEAESASYYPYSGCTPPEGVTAKLKYSGKRGLSAFLGVRNKIAVVSMPVFEAGIGLVFKKRAGFPADFEPPKKQGSPVVATFVISPNIGLARFMGAKGVVCVMRGISRDNARNQYLPFIKRYAGIPALWVDEEEGAKIIEAAKRREEATLTLDASVYENADTETVYAVLPGKDPKKTIIINTHTDGSNAFEENAPIALLSLARYFAAKPVEEREHTLVFSFITGHFQLHQFGSGLFQATGKFLRRHPELWNGKNGGALATAGVALEHLGCTEWRDTPDKKQFVQVSEIDPELVYTSNQKMAEIYLDAIKDRTQTKTLVLRPKNMVHFGEGQPIWKVGIPSIALCPGPDYLCNNAPSGYIEKTNYTLFSEQIETFRRVIETLDKKSRAELGKSDGSAFGFKF
jgi:hypothetical protein